MKPEPSSRFPWFEQPFLCPSLTTAPDSLSFLPSFPCSKNWALAFISLLVTWTLWSHLRPPFSWGAVISDSCYVNWTRNRKLSPQCQFRQTFSSASFFILEPIFHIFFHFAFKLVRFNSDMNGGGIYQFERVTIRDIKCFSLKKNKTKKLYLWNKNIKTIWKPNSHFSRSTFSAVVPIKMSKFHCDFF